MKEIISTTVVLIILAVIVALIIRKIIKDKKAGIGLCGGDCSACKGSCGCK